ncbi:MAG: uncharacterized membrane protein (UPF0127 family) [Arenicella sp.]|jgi:uncharacterized membrane protein (UPF0127 family)
MSKMKSYKNKSLIQLFGLTVCLLVLSFSGLANAEFACETSNLALESMPDGIVTIDYADGKTKEFSVRLANSSSTRAAGFQRVCKSTIAAKPILFVFAQALRPSFHMNNVVAGIDIAFINSAGRLDSIHNMSPYVLGSNHTPRYQSEGFIQSALEAYPGFFAEHSVDDSVMISWRPAEK